MSERLEELKIKLREFWDTIKESEAYQQLKAKYDEQDENTKIIVQLGSVLSVCFLVLFSVILGISKVNGLKNSIDEQEQLVQYLQTSADQIKQLKMQHQIDAAIIDNNAPLNEWASTVLAQSQIDISKVEITAEKAGTEDKTTKEILVDIKLNQVNLRQIVNYLFNITEQGKTRSINVRNLSIDTKGDPSGWMDASITLAAFKAK